MTDAEGGFLLEGVAEVDGLELRVRAVGYRPARLSGPALRRGGPVEVRLRSGLRIRGRVVAADGGGPVTSYHVSIGRVAPPWVRVAMPTPRARRAARRCQLRGRPAEGISTAQGRLAKAVWTRSTGTGAAV